MKNEKSAYNRALQHIKQRIKSRIDEHERKAEIAIENNSDVDKAFEFACIQECNDILAVLDKYIKIVKFD